MITPIWEFVADSFKSFLKHVWPLKDCAQWKTREGHAFANLIGTDEQTDEEKQVSAMYFVYAFVKL
jgi:hypothetical protein